MTTYEEILELIPMQFRDKPKLNSILQAFAKQFDELRDVFNDLDGLVDIETAKGKNLDRVGEIVCQTRKQGFDILRQSGKGYMSDDVYRKTLRYKVLKNVTNGTYEDFMKSIHMIWDNREIKYIEDANRPATIIVDLANIGVDEKDPSEGRVVAIKPSGVLLVYLIHYVLSVCFSALEEIKVPKMIIKGQWPNWLSLVLDGSWKLNGDHLLNGIELTIYNKLKMKIDVPHTEEVQDVIIRIIHDYWPLDGTNLLDGTKLLDAVLIEEEL